MVLKKFGKVRNQVSLNDDKLPVWLFIPTSLELSDIEVFSDWLKKKKKKKGSRFC